MFPISDSIKSNKFPLITIALIAINIYIFLQEINASNPEAFISAYALIPSTISLSNPQTLIPFITSTFLHGGFLHIISNMWFLWIFGDDVEAYFGRFKFLLVYLVAGVAGNLLQYFLAPNSSIPLIGASGAISGVLGAYYILFPQSKIKTFLPILFFFTIVDIPAVLYLFYWFFLQLISGILSLPVEAQGGVAFWAHIGGFIIGIVFAKNSRSSHDGYIEGEIVS